LARLAALDREERRLLGALGGDAAALALPVGERELERRCAALVAPRRLREGERGEARVAVGLVDRLEPRRDVPRLGRRAQREGVDAGAGAGDGVAPPAEAQRHGALRVTG